jgi:hypothetical protein
MDIEKGIKDITEKRWGDVDIMWLVGVIRSLQKDLAHLQEYSTKQYKTIVGRDELYEETQKQLIELRKYVISHELMIGESTGWTALKKMYDIGEYAKKSEADNGG